MEHIWRLNVEPAKFVCRMGSHADGRPADSSVHKNQEGGASQSNAFTPVSTAPLAAAAIQHGMVNQGLALIEETADVIINHTREPWSGLLLFDSRTGKCFYGLHYSDCLILWDVMHALIGVHTDMSDRSLKLAPPRIPVKAPVFGKLFCGQVEFSADGGGAQLRLANIADRPSIMRELIIKLPAPPASRSCRLEQGAGAGNPGRRSRDDHPGQRGRPPPRGAEAALGLVLQRRATMRVLGISGSPPRRQHGNPHPDRTQRTGGRGDRNQVHFPR